MNIFISYAEGDHETAKKLYNDFKRSGVTPWLDSEDILPGQNQEIEIKQAIKKSDCFLALLSTNSVSERGFVQKQQKIALKMLDEFPEGEIYIIPVRLDECKLADEKLQRLKYVDLFHSYENGLNNILRSLEEKRNIHIVSTDTLNRRTIFAESLVVSKMFIKAFWKSFIWILLIILFGLMQLWLRICSSYVRKDILFSFEKILLDGVIVFFVTAIITTITIDFYFSKKRVYPKWAVGFMFGLFPCIIVLASAWLFGICLGQGNEVLNTHVIKSIEYVIITMSFIYSIAVKILKFYQDEK